MVEERCRVDVAEIDDAKQLVLLQWLSGDEGSAEQSRRAAVDRGQRTL